MWGFFLIYWGKTYGLGIEEYKKIDPTVSEIAKILGNLGRVVEILAVSSNFDNFDDENTKINLMQLGVIMSQIEQAINTDNMTELEKLKESLQKHIS